MRFPDITDTVCNSWKSDLHDSALTSLAAKSTSCLQTLIQWGKDKVGDYPRRIQDASARVQASIDSLRFESFRDSLNKAEDDLALLLQEEEIFWKQRSRELGLKERDKNTRWFHYRASYRRKVNRLVGLFHPDGRWCEEPCDILQIIEE